MNQQNAQNQNQGNNQNTQECLTVFFVIFDGQSKVAIQCTFTEKVEDAINRYRAKTGDNDKTDKFLYNTKNVCPEMTVAEQGLVNGPRIKVISTLDIKGAKR